MLPARATTFFTKNLHHYQSQTQKIEAIDSLVPVRILVASNYQCVNRLLHLVEFVQQIELRSAKLPSLILLVLTGAEDDHFSSKLFCKLDSKMTKSANADDTDALSRFDHGGKGIVSRRSGAL